MTVDAPLTYNPRYDLCVGCSQHTNDGLGGGKIRY